MSLVGKRELIDHAGRVAGGGALAMAGTRIKTWRFGARRGREETVQYTRDRAVRDSLPWVGGQAELSDRLIVSLRGRSARQGASSRARTPRM